MANSTLLAKQAASRTAILKADGLAARSFPELQVQGRAQMTGLPVSFGTEVRKRAAARCCERRKSEHRPVDGCGADVPFHVARVMRAKTSTTILTRNRFIKEAI